MNLPAARQKKIQANSMRSSSLLEISEDELAEGTFIEIENLMLVCPLRAIGNYCRRLLTGRQAVFRPAFFKAEIIFNQDGTRRWYIF